MDENQHGGASSRAQDNIESGAAHARHAADDLKAAAGAVADQYRDRAGEVINEARDRAGQVINDARDRAGEVINDARGRARAFQEDGTAYVRENPTKALFSALAVGFVLGLLFRR